jgi:hypothetical protein
MGTKAVSKNRLNTVLIVFVLLNIIGDVGNVIFWYASPSSQGSLVGGPMGDVVSQGGLIAGWAGTEVALAIGTVTLLVVAAVYAVALFGLMKRKTWGPLLVIAISIVNRVLAVFLYELSPAFAFWGVWTVILVVVAYLDYRQLTAKKTEQPQLAKPDQKSTV